MQASFSQSEEVFYRSHITIAIDVDFLVIVLAFIVDVDFVVVVALILVTVALAVVVVALALVPRRCCFCVAFLLFMFCVRHVFLSVHFSLVITCWERANLLALLCVMFYCVLSLSRVVSWVKCGT